MRGIFVGCSVFFEISPNFWSRKEENIVSCIPAILSKSSFQVMSLESKTENPEILCFLLSYFDVSVDAIVSGVVPA